MAPGVSPQPTDVPCQQEDPKRKRFQVLGFGQLGMGFACCHVGHPAPIPGLWFSTEVDYPNYLVISSQQKHPINYCLNFHTASELSTGANESGSLSAPRF
ncbi:unnamed protein product [Natator depressus]